MAIVAFRVDPAFPWLPGDIDRGPDEAALNSFVDFVSAEQVVRTFGELTRFREEPILALRPYEALASDGDQRPTRRQTTRAPAFHSVPSYVGSAPFMGRVADLDALDAWAVSDDPVMVVEAIGGTRATSSIEGLAARMWWSFYDGSASMTRFLQEVLAYTTDRPWGEIAKLDHSALAADVAAVLRSQPYLLVMDGFERLLLAYHDVAPAKLGEDETAVSQRSLIEARAHDVVRDPMRTCSEPRSRMSYPPP